jgi:F-type H+-transporting ATPase subunit b
MQRTIVSAALLLAIALAAPAYAAEGGLSIFPSGFEACVAREGVLAKLGCFAVTLPFTQFGHLLLLFVVLIFPVNRLVLQPLLGVLDERSARIEGARKRAQEIGAQADAVFGRYQAAIEAARKQADALRNRALDDARADQARVLANARLSAESEIGEARSGVARALASARAGLRPQAETLAREAAERVLGRAL